MLCVVCPGVCHIVQDIMRVQTIPASAQQAFRASLECFIEGTSQKAEAWKVLMKGQHLSAICMSRCGLKVPSVSMYIALPSPPPMSMGSCTSRTCQQPSWQCMMQEIAFMAALVQS